MKFLRGGNGDQKESERAADRRKRILFDVKGSKNVPQDFTGAPYARALTLALARYYEKIKGRDYSP